MAGPIADAFDDGRHPGLLEEWWFTAWTPQSDLGIVSGHRIVGPTAWYWAALARSGRPLLHITDFEVPVRSDPFIVKGEQMWAEHVRDAPMEQWSVGNETYAAALDDPADALGRAYGVPTPIAFDLEWYAVADPRSLPDPPADVTDPNLGADRWSGYVQEGVVHGRIELFGEEPIELVEVPARRWHRWTSASTLPPLELPVVTAHTGVRAPFAFPDGVVADLVLTPSGWGRRFGRSDPE